MKTNHGLTLLAVMISVVPFVSHADSLECQGDFISPGITEAQLLEACGEPASRNGADLIYRIPGSIPMVVTLGNGVVMFIRDLDNETDPASPLGDTP
jgi:Protein of unknown function (DUF2845)